MKEHSPSSSPIGQHKLSHSRFETWEQHATYLLSEEFLSKNTHMRFRTICHTLLKMIMESSEGSFLLPTTLDWIHWCNQNSLLPFRLSLFHFEFWLNQFSNLSMDVQHLVRGKITGKYIPRSEYQLFFPIGFGQTFFGSHFVVSHLSPDIDTTIGSFWGWVDAFGGKVSEGIHYWCLPNAKPDAYMHMVFKRLISVNALHCLVRTASTLSMTALDLANHNRLDPHKNDAHITLLTHDDENRSMIYVDQEGYYLGDWRSHDFEGVRQISMMFNSCMRWLENQLNTKLIGFFSTKGLQAESVKDLISEIEILQLKDSESVLELPSKHRKNFHEFCRSILGLPKGLSTPINALISRLQELGMTAFGEFYQLLSGLHRSEIFDPTGEIIEDRPLLFGKIDELFSTLNKAIASARHYVERLDVAMRIKYEVLHHSPHYVTLESDIDELRSKIRNYPSITVVLPETDGRLYPIGSITSQMLHQSRLGTVSVRDFCNQDEMRMASYLEVISVVDHHKSALQTSTPPTAIIGDAQSVNVLVAEQTFRINDRYSTAGMSLESINSQLEEWIAKPDTPLKTRILTRLLEKKSAAERRGDFYIHPDHEFAAYLSFVYAILDDTDLLSKITQRDLVCLTSLLNRLKTLITGRETEVIDLENLPHGKGMLKEGGRRLLANDELYSIYSEIFAFKCQEVEKNLQAYIDGKGSNIFADVKEQNGCCRVSQTKLFASNFSLYLAHDSSIRSQWAKETQNIYEHRTNFDLHIHMMSTISGAEEVYRSEEIAYKHRDELWIWNVDGEVAREHLKTFLSGLQRVFEEKGVVVEIEAPAGDLGEIQKLYSSYFSGAKFTPSDASAIAPVTVIRFDAGSLNSRKTQISPYLPKLVS
ncbi:MAG: hypothetical protein KDK40_04515 [Chlamydiia bacterium]|nr:hypothetical protein [Chlamydiia bacterium]